MTKLKTPVTMEDYKYRIQKCRIALWQSFDNHMPDETGQHLSYCPHSRCSWVISPVTVPRFLEKPTRLGVTTVQPRVEVGGGRIVTTWVEA